MRKAVKKLTDSIVDILGYIGLLLQFCWLGILYGSWAIQSGALQAFIDATGSRSPQPSIDFVLPEIIRGPLSVIVVICIVFLTIYFVRTTPQTVTHVTIRATEKTAKAAQPVIKKIVHTPRNRKKITPMISLLVTKLIGSLLLMTATLPAHRIVSLDKDTAAFVTYSLWLFATIMIVMHYTLAALWHLSNRTKV